MSAGTRLLRSLGLFVIGTSGLVFGLWRGIPSAESLAQVQELREVRQGYVTIIMAKGDLPPGHSIESEDLVSMRLPAAQVPDGVQRRREDVEGRITAARLLSLEPVRVERLVLQDR